MLHPISKELIFTPSPCKITNMKRGLLFILGIFLLISAQAQTAEKSVKKIDVWGSGEIEITPDEIYFSISIREYKNKNTKVTLEALEDQLKKAIRNAGIPLENLTIANIYGFNLERKKRQNPEFMARKQFLLKLASLEKINDILSQVEDEGIESVTISSYTHSKMDEYRKQVRIMAMKAAKEKADYMLGAIGATSNAVLTVEEVNQGTPYYAPAAYANLAIKAMDTAVEAATPEFRKIKVRAEVRVSFSIQ